MQRGLAPLHVIKFQVCSCNIASIRAGESPSIVRESQVNVGFPFNTLTKSIIKIGIPTFDENSETSENIPTSVNKHYHYGTMTSEFMNSSKWLHILDILIVRLEYIDKSQSAIDNYYQDMLYKVFQEMDSHIQYKEASKRTKKHYKNHRPFWNEDLTAAWKNMSSAEKIYLKDKSRNSQLREQFHN